MRSQTLITVLASGLAWAQQGEPPEGQRLGPLTSSLVALLEEGDPIVDGKLGSRFLASGSLDDAIRVIARSERVERTPRLRALRLVRALDRAALVRAAERRDLSWWLALHEISRDVPEAVSAPLLKRAFAEDSACTAALKELDAATEVANRFCVEWNEISDAKDGAKYEALEAELKKSAPAVVPALFSLLSVPPSIAFAGPQNQPVTARQQVRAILALSVVLQCEQALPLFVMHAAGPSLTQSTNAAMAVERFSGESFGASLMVQGNDAALLAWWKQHRAEHRVVLDYLHDRTLQWARTAIQISPPIPANAAWGASVSLHRLVGDARDERPEADIEAMRNRLEEIEAAWVQAPR
jgi:hypothetical protein